MMDHAHEDQHLILLKRRTEELQTLVRVAQLINILDLDSVLSETLLVTSQAVGADTGSFFLLDEQGNPIQRFITQRNMPPEMTREVARDVLDKGLAGWCVRHRTGAISDDVSQDERWYVFPDDDQTNVRSALVVPVLWENELQGILTLVSSQTAYFDTSHLQLVTAVANQASTAIRNARLFDSLQAQQRQLALVLQNTGEALITVDPDLRVLVVNPEAITLLGYLPETAHAVIGKKLSDVATGAVFEEVVKTIQETPLRTVSQSFEFRDETDKRDFVVTISALPGEQNDFGSGYVIGIHDVTSLKDLSRLKTHMLYVLSHDLKNPINIIWGYLDLLRIDSQNKQPADQRFVDGMLRAVQRMENLIEETLTADKFMSSGVQSRRYRFSATDVITESLDDLLELAQSKKLHLVREITLEQDEILGDRLQIREAMKNLISNAIKYTPEMGTVTIRASSADGRFYFAVEDTGMGIPAELQGELFKQFYRAPRAAMAGIEGTGLGLSLVKTAVETQQGQVWFKSEEGSGSTFGFWLPLAPANTVAG